MEKRRLNLTFQIVYSIVNNQAGATKCGVELSSEMTQTSGLFLFPDNQMIAI